MSESEFWSLTPRQFFLLVHREEERQRRIDSRFAVLDHLIYSAFFTGEKLTPQDFMPGGRQQTVEDQALLVEHLAAALGGTIQTEDK